MGRTAIQSAGRRFFHISETQDLNTTNRDFVYAQSDYHFNRHLTGLFGFKYEDERGVSASSGYPADLVQRGNYSYTMQLAGDVFSRVYYTIGSGIENNALFGVAATPRASLAYYLLRPRASRLLNGTKLRASFGKGIKEPNIYEQVGSLFDLLSTLPNGSQLIAQYGIAPIGAQTSTNATMAASTSNSSMGAAGSASLTFITSLGTA